MSKAVKRLAIAWLWHEGNSFLPVPTTAESFRAVEWHSGEAAAAFCRGTATEGGATIAFLDDLPTGTAPSCAAPEPRLQGRCPPASTRRFAARSSPA